MQFTENHFNEPPTRDPLEQLLKAQDLLRTQLRGATAAACLCAACTARLPLSYRVSCAASPGLSHQQHPPPPPPAPPGLLSLFTGGLPSTAFLPHQPSHSYGADAATAAAAGLRHQQEWAAGGVQLQPARRKNATRETTAALKAWLGDHLSNPYPTKGEKVMLAIITKMSLTQVSTWFANARRRLKKEGKMTWTCRNTYDDGEDSSSSSNSTDHHDGSPDHFKAAVAATIALAEEDEGYNEPSGEPHLHTPIGENAAVQPRRRRLSPEAHLTRRRPLRLTLPTPEHRQHHQAAAADSLMPKPKFWSLVDTALVCTSDKRRPPTAPSLQAASTQQACT